MKVTLHSTKAITEVNGARARIWEGTTETGIRVYAAIADIAVHAEDDQAEFERDLERCEPASADAVRAFDLRLFMD